MITLPFRIVDEINEGNRELWNEYVNNHPSGTIFQTPEFFDLYADDDRYEQVFTGIIDDNGKPRAVAFAIVMKEFTGLRKQFSARTIIYGGPLLDPKSAEPKDILELLLDALVRKTKRTSLYIEFRNFKDVSGFKDVYNRYGFKYREHMNLIINTKDRDGVQSGISKSKLRQIRVTLEAGAEIKQASTPSEFEEFYYLLKDLYREKVRKPLPSIEFFRKFFDETKNGRLGVILIVKYKGQVVAGMVCPITPGKAIHEWYVCGNDRQYHDIFPSVLITWAGIEYALDHDLPSFDFMGIGQPGQEYGVRHFKTRFGGEKVNFGRFIRINNKLKYSIAKSGFYILSLVKKV
jgi:serine/alanine adding enzyme